MRNQATYRTHSKPVWRDSANALVQASLERAEISEQLWCEEIGDGLFRVCCIPFFLRNVALGDVIKASDYLFESVQTSSGRYVFRLFFKEEQRKWRQQTIEELHRSNFLTEWYSEGLLAVDAENERRASMMAAFLMDCRNRGYLTFETGRV